MPPTPTHPQASTSCPSHQHPKNIPLNSMDSLEPLPRFRSLALLRNADGTNGARPTSMTARILPWLVERPTCIHASAQHPPRWLSWWVAPKMRVLRNCGTSAFVDCSMVRARTAAAPVRHSASYNCNTRLLALVYISVKILSPFSSATDTIVERSAKNGVRNIVS